MEHTVREIFSVDGLLSQALPEFRQREGQLTFALAVENALYDRHNLVVEAEPGSGKTLAYLLPLLVSGRKALIAVASRLLMQQIISRDLPIAIRALQSKTVVGQLHGRRQYLCPYLAERRSQSREHRSVAVILQAVLRWWREGGSGRLFEYPQALEGSLVDLLSSRTTECQAELCPEFARCPLMRDRKQARDADVLVTNHHLLYSDLSLREEGYSDLLPQMETIVVDEAHRITDIAVSASGRNLSMSKLRQWLRRCQQCLAREVPDLVSVRQYLDRFEPALTHFEQHFAGEFAAVDRDTQWQAIAQLEQGLIRLQALLRAADDRHHTLREIGKNLLQWRLGLSAMNELRERTDNSLVWWRRWQGELVLHANPVLPWSCLSALPASNEANWILTSATLSINGDFSHYVEQTGLSVEQCVLVSPEFDRSVRGRIMLVDDIVEPGDEAFSEQLVERCAPILEAPIRSLFLCSSHAAVKQFAALLRDRVPRLFVQGERPDAELLQDFIASDAGVLLGTGRFWEGMDIPLARLQCVIIDKLPFAAPGDTLQRIKQWDCQRRNKSYFSDLALPQALIRLRQGVGRLVRNEDCEGGIVIGDTRLLRRDYGPQFLAALPTMPRVGSAEAMVEFLQSEFE